MRQLTMDTLNLGQQPVVTLIDYWSRMQLPILPLPVARIEDNSAGRQLLIIQFECMNQLNTDTEKNHGHASTEFRN